MRRIIKRDGKYQEFDTRKIRQAILMAFQDEQPDSIPNVRPLVRGVVDELPPGDVDVETIQDTVEKVLMKGHPDVAKSYIIYREHQTEARKKREAPDPAWIADYIHVSKYARHRPEWSRRELRDETIDRTMEMHQRRWPELSEEIAWAFNMVRQGKVLASMRSMQFGGKAVEKNNERVYNCSFTPVDRIRAFQEIFYLLLCGCGVGYSVQWRHVDELPKLGIIDESKVKHYVIPDTIEGWADSIGELFQSFLEGYHIEYSYHQIRDEGSPLVTSGGKAPGHLPLKRCLERVRSVLRNAQGRKLRPIECHDIICYIAEAVLAGGIRRSSLICLFSPEDTEMLYAKAKGQFDPVKGINSQREMANNSAVFLRDSVSWNDFARVLRVASEGYGDPGFYFTNDLDYGCNPCGEIGMNPVIQKLIRGIIKKLTGFSFCNLSEVNMAACATVEEFLLACRAAALIGTLQAAYTSFPYLGTVTEEIVRREALIGVGLTGMVDNPELSGNARALRDGAQMVVETNQEWAEKLGIEAAARCTTVKPSGTSSLWLGCVGSGIHPHHARRYFRRITANPLEPAAQYFKKLNPHAVEVKPNSDWSLIFPVQAPSNATTVKEETAREFLDRVFMTYENWIVPGTSRPDSSQGLTHNVSCTVTVRQEEVEQVQKMVWDNRHRIAAMSFAPYLLDQVFPFAPREEVHDEGRWNELIRLWKPVDWSQFQENEDTTDLGSVPACEGASCEIN